MNSAVPSGYRLKNMHGCPLGQPCSVSGRQSRLRAGTVLADLPMVSSAIPLDRAVFFPAGVDERDFRFLLNGEKNMR